MGRQKIYRWHVGKAPRVSRGWGWRKLEARDGKRRGEGGTDRRRNARGRGGKEKKDDAHGCRWETNDRRPTEDTSKLLHGVAVPPLFTYVSLPPSLSHSRIRSSRGLVTSERPISKIFGEAATRATEARAFLTSILIQAMPRMLARHRSASALFIGIRSFELPSATSGGGNWGIFHEGVGRSFPSIRVVSLTFWNDFSDRFFFLHELRRRIDGASKDVGEILCHFRFLNLMVDGSIWGDGFFDWVILCHLVVSSIGSVFE